MSADDERHNRQELVKLGTMLNDIFVVTATEALRSVQEGSELTGAPGQPVDKGDLLVSWQLTFPSPDSAVIGTDSDHAKPIEDGVGKYGPLTLRSKVGGWHSVKLTAANLGRIHDFAKRKVAGHA